MRRGKFTLGELCVIEKGSTGILKAIPGEYPLVVTGEQRKSHNVFQFDNDAVIIPLVSGTGHGHASIKRIHFQTGKFALGSILCAVIPKDKSKLNAEYLYYFLELNRENELVARMRGMANVTLPIKEIAKIKIPLPSLDDQIEFIKMYRSLGQKSNDISNEFKHQLNLVKKLRQQLLQDAVQGKLVEQNDKDEPASVLLQKIKTEKEQRIKDKKLKKEKKLQPIRPEELSFDIPENWVWCRLAEVTDFNPRNKASDHAEAGFIPMPLISSKYNEVPKFEITRWANIKSGFTHFTNNDVVVAKITPCFENSKAGIIKDLPNGIGAGTTELYVIRGNSMLLPEFIYAIIKNHKFLKSGERVMRGVSGQQRVPSEFVCNLLIPLPPINEQHRIVQKLEQLMQICGALEASIKQSQQQNEQLIQQVLKEALTEENTIEAKEDKRYNALLLAAEIIWQLNPQQTLGRIKLQKLIFLCDRTQQMNLPVNFLKWAMGPYDPELQQYIEKELAERKWFKYNEDESLKYQPLDNAGGHKADFEKYFVNNKTAINHLIQLFENARSAKIEIVATLFACWEEIKDNNQLVNDTALLTSFYNWSDKKKKYSQEKVIDALRWMKAQGLVPQN
ncbi:MAG: hypothetical protein JWQ66_4096 [Mucilaginibacter sp.]|nr:hypothetical protein [Mucilaginibacter sp.]